ncbi:hypothetical protein [Frigoribacterium sp. VKM Ac-2836]|uniref:hypothetical protein n=1 Tax=Frigoribacterium sp. VKM Ac-2836 TaxID=2739014 RepID=UPI001567B576|nr:hypothetical protein [Frigoribacterium sp. VKM Ac-2836]NRD26318.1 hypothetical protein [Frigoribacterium sp. VKM Ac-2836]
MTLRITSATTKVGLVLAVVIVGFGLGLSVALVFGETATLVVTLALSVGTSLFCARVFRGPDEPVGSARPAWQLTGGPASSVVLAVFFGLSGLSLLIPAAVHVETATSMVAGVVYAGLGLAYLFSGWKQRSRQPSVERHVVADDG